MATNGLTIDLAGVCLEYPSSRHATLVLSNLDLQVKSGEFVSIEGPSGSGKSSLLRVIAGLVEPSRGIVRVCDINFNVATESMKATLRRQKIGFLHQFYNLLPDFTVHDNVRLPLILDQIDTDSADRRVRGVLQMFRISEHADKYPENLSGGEMLRVALARALAIKPKVILADEPTGNLDRENSERIVGILKQLSEDHDVSVVLVTHDSAVSAVADTQYWLSDGQLSARHQKSLVTS